LKIWGPLSAACDITIFVSMSFFVRVHISVISPCHSYYNQLLRRRRDTQRRSTHSRLTQVVQVVVETGMTTGMSRSPSSSDYHWKTFLRYRRNLLHRIAKIRRSHISHSRSCHE
jgi:exonuclease V gamma subunit